MFCPKCGAELPDGAKFCGKCGNEMQIPGRFCASCGSEVPEIAKFCPKCGSQYEDAQGQATAFQQGSAPNPAQAFQQQPQPGGASGAAPKKQLPFTPVSIIARVVAAIALVVMFLPWLEVPSLQYLAGVASSINIKVNDDFKYPMYETGEVAKALDQLYALGSSSSSSKYTSGSKYSTTKSSSKGGPFGLVNGVFFALWVIAILVTVAGLVFSFVGRRSTGVLIAAGILIALVALLWFAAISYLDGEFARQLARLLGSRPHIFVIPPAVPITIVLGILTAVLGGVGKSMAVKESQKAGAVS